MPDTNMSDVAIGVMVGGAAGFALGRWTEKAHGKKQAEKLKAALKKGAKQDKKSTKHPKHSRRHDHHHHQHHGYRPYQSMPLQHHYPAHHGKHPGHFTETTTVYAHNRPQQQHNTHHLLPPNHIPNSIPHHQTNAHIGARSEGPPMYSSAHAAPQYGPSRYY